MKKLYEEAIVEMNGFELTPSQSMTLRIALESFIQYLIEEGLGDDEMGLELKKAYLDRCAEIRGYMYFHSRGDK